MSDSYLRDLFDDTLDIARDYVRSGGVRVAVKTNLGPEIPVYVGSGDRRGNPLGIKAGVIVRDRDGNVISQFGEPPATEPLKVFLLLAVVSVVGFVIVRGVLK